MDKEINYKEEKKIIELRHKNQKEIMKLEKDIHFETMDKQFEMDKRYIQLQKEFSNTPLGIKSSPLHKEPPLEPEAKVLPIIPSAPEFQPTQEDQPQEEVDKYEASRKKYGN